MFYRILILTTLCAYCFGEDDSVQDPQYRGDYTYKKRANGWLKLYRSPMNWENARLQCHYEGAVLASPLNEELMHGIYEVMHQQKYCPETIFSGVSSSIASGVYTSVEGVSINKLKVYWVHDEPVYFYKSCLAFLYNGPYMGSKDCDDKLPFICYKEHTMDLVINECGTVDNEYNLNKSTKTCYKYHSDEVAWDRAFTICQAEGAHLAILNEVDDWLSEKMGTNIAATGFKKISEIWWDVHGNRVTLQNDNATGDHSTDHPKSHSMSSSHSYPSHHMYPSRHTYPTRGTTNDCGALSKDSQFKPISCTEPHPFICEKTVDSLKIRRPTVTVNSIY